MIQTSPLIKGNLQTIVLKVLADYGKMYGYEIAQRVKQLSGGAIQLTEGAMYPTLHQMEKDGYLKTEVVPIGKRVRKYYRLTPVGKKRVDERVEDFMAFTKAMGALLNVKVSIN